MMERHPGEMWPALAFSDWLEDNGKPAHAELIRLHHNPETAAYRAQGPTDLGYLADTDRPGGYVSRTAPDPLKKIFSFSSGDRHDVVGRRFLMNNKRGWHTWVTFAARLPKEHAKPLAAALSEEEPDHGGYIPHED